MAGVVAAACAAPTSPASLPASSTTASGPGSSIPPRTTATANAPATPSPGCATTPAPGAPVRSTHVDIPLKSSGAERTYKQYVPAAYDATPTALLVDLHGYLSGAAGQVAMSNFGAFSEKAGFVVATPQGNGPLPYWNAVPHAELPDDVTFVSDLIDDVSARLCIDPARVYVDGLSNGAFLTSLVACRLADKVAAVAAVAGVMFPADCAPSRPVPILGIHGTADRFVSFGGGPGDALPTMKFNEDSTKAFDGLAFAAAPATVAKWAAAEQCTTPPQEQPVSASVKVIRYEGCRGGSVVELYVVDGGGHTWPGSAFSKASESILGPTTFEIDANDVIWNFFKAHPMPR